MQKGQVEFYPEKPDRALPSGGAEEWVHGVRSLPAHVDRTGGTADLALRGA